MLAVLKANCGTVSVSAPGLACSQAEHFVRFDSLRTIQVLHSQLALCFATILLKPVSSAGDIVDFSAGAEVVAAAAPGRGVSQATHLLLSWSLRMQQTPHSHLEPCCATRFLKPESNVSGLVLDIEAVGFGAAAAA